MVRTFAHHQITADARGVAGLQPVVSDNGNRIVFALGPAADGKPRRLAAVDFAGGDVAVLDDTPNIDQQDVTADGSRVIYIVNYSELRIVAGDGTGRRVWSSPMGRSTPRDSPATDGSSSSSRPAG